LQRLLSLVEAAFSDVKGRGPGHELALHLWSEHRPVMLVLVHEAAEFVSEQPGDARSHRHAERIAVLSPRRPHRQ
jgi:hypothetical protein